MGEIYLNAQSNGQSHLAKVKHQGIGLKIGNDIGIAQQVWFRPGPDVFKAWEDDPEAFAATHADNPLTNPNFFDWKPIWDLTITFHYGDGTTETRNVRQGSLIGSLPSAAPLQDTVEGQQVNRTFWGWGFNSSAVNKVRDTYVVNSNIHLYALYNHVVTFKSNRNTVYSQKIVERHTQIGDMPTIETIEGHSGDWKDSYSGTFSVITPNVIPTEDMVLYPTLEVCIVFDLNNSGIIVQGKEDRFYTTSFEGYETLATIAERAPIVDVTLENNVVVENEDYDFQNTGKIFQGWYTAKEGGTKVERSNSTARTNKIFYAHWKSNMKVPIHRLYIDGSINWNTTSIDVITNPIFGEITHAQIDSYYINDSNQQQWYLFESLELDDYLEKKSHSVQFLSLDSTAPLGYYKDSEIVDRDLTTQIRAEHTKVIDGVEYSYEETSSAYGQRKICGISYQIENGSTLYSATNINEDSFDWADDKAKKVFDFTNGTINLLSYMPFIQEGNRTYLIDNFLLLSPILNAENGLRFEQWYKDSSDNIEVVNDNLCCQFKKVWKVKSFTQPTINDLQIGWEIVDVKNDNVYPTAYTITGVLPDSSQELIASNYNQTTYTFAAANDITKYDSIILTPTDGKYYNDLSRSLIYYYVTYNTDDGSRTTGITVPAQERLLKNTIVQLQQPSPNYYLYSSSRGHRIFRNWKDSSDNIISGNTIQVDTYKSLYANYSDKYQINKHTSSNKIFELEALDSEANRTYRVSWVAATALDDNVPASYYKVYDGQGNEITPNYISSLNFTANTLQNYSGLTLYAYNSDKTLYNTGYQALSWVTITFKKGNTTVATYKRLSGETIGTLPTTTKDGYIFNGWSTSSSGSVDITENSTFTADISLYAQWTAATTYTVTFNTRGGSTIAPITGSTITLPDSSLSDTQGLYECDYILDGWETVNGTLVGEAGDSYTPTSNITLYARWSLYDAQLEENNFDTSNVYRTYWAAVPSTMPTNGLSSLNTSLWVYFDNPLNRTINYTVTRTDTNNQNYSASGQTSYNGYVEIQLTDSSYNMSYSDRFGTIEIELDDDDNGSYFNISNLDTTSYNYVFDTSYEPFIEGYTDEIDNGESIKLILTPNVVVPKLNTNSSTSGTYPFVVDCTWRNPMQHTLRFTIYGVYWDYSSNDFRVITGESTTIYSSSLGTTLGLTRKDIGLFYIKVEDITNSQIYWSQLYNSQALGYEMPMNVNDVALKKADIYQAPLFVSSSKTNGNYTPITSLSAYPCQSYNGSTLTAAISTNASPQVIILPRNSQQVSVNYSIEWQRYLTLQSQWNTDYSTSIQTSSNNPVIVNYLAGRYQLTSTYPMQPKAKITTTLNNESVVTEVNTATLYPWSYSENNNGTTINYIDWQYQASEQDLAMIPYEHSYNQSTKKLTIKIKNPARRYIQCNGYKYDSNYFSSQQQIVLRPGYKFTMTASDTSTFYSNAEDITFNVTLGSTTNDRFMWFQVISRTSIPSSNTSTTDIEGIYWTQQMEIGTN